MGTTEALRVALLCSFNLDLLPRYLQPALARRGLKGELYLSGYGQWEAEALDKASPLYAFAPHMVFLFPEAQDLLAVLLTEPTAYSTQDSERLGVAAWHRVETVIHGLLARLPATTVVSCHNLVVPPTNALGLLEGNSQHSIRVAVNRFNDLLGDRVSQEPRLFLFDYAALVLEHGWRGWADSRMWHLGRMRLSREALTALAERYCRYIAALKTPRRKCLVLDLDNTLWGGVVGEDGSEGIVIGHSGLGLAYREVQAALLNLSQRGVILAINSRNNPSDAMAALERHPDMILRPQHFACMEINWDDKATAEIRETFDRIGLPPAERYSGFDFWADRFVELRGDELAAELPPASCRVLALRPAAEVPQLVSTSRHITQGIVDVIEEKWDAQTKTLSGLSRVVAGDPYELRIARPAAGQWEVSGALCSVPGDGESPAIALGPEEPGGWRCEINSKQTQQVNWSIRFE